MSELTIRRYSLEDQRTWDAFVKKACNGHFLFMRGYMEYHADRFPDCSFIVMHHEKWIAVIAGTLSTEGVWSSHAGLTFGGFVFDNTVGTLDILSSFSLLEAELRLLGAKMLRYKPLPWIYTHCPAEASLYALFRCGAQLVSRQISSALVLGTQKMEERRRRRSKLAEKMGVQITESIDFKSFWNLLNTCLNERHDVAPVHSSSELELLAGRFPNNIRLFIAKIENRLVAGTLLYITDRVVHTQYLATSTEGREIGALDALISHLLTSSLTQQRYFDFGVSCEDNGRILNEGLLTQKEGFGGRAVVHDVYECIL